MQLEGTRVIVTGGAQGIGAAAVRAFVAEGAAVASLDVADDLGEQVVAATDGPGRARYHHCDVARRDEVETTFADAVADLGGLDALLNVAGVERNSPAESIPDDDWDLILDVNARGTLNTNRAAFPFLRDAGGRIVNFGSAAGVTGMPGAAHYAASKGAVLAWTRTVAKEWARYGISVNAIAPGMWTPMYDTHRSRMTPDQLAMHDAMMKQTVPLGGRLGDPDRDMAPVLVFLLTDGGRFITGQTLAVDGGMLTIT